MPAWMPSVIKCMEYFQDRNMDIANQPYCGWLRSATTEWSKEVGHAVIRDNQRAMVRDVPAQLGIGPHAILEILVTLEYQKVCSCWVLHLLVDECRKTWWLPVQHHWWLKLVPTFWLRNEMTLWNGLAAFPKTKDCTLGSYSYGICLLAYQGMCIGWFSA